MKWKVLILFISLFATGRVAAQRIVFTPQWTAQSQFAGYYVAQELGFYRDAGLDVEITHPTASEFSLDRLEKGRCNAITMQLFDAIFHIEKGVEMVNILQTSQRTGHVIVARQDDIKSLSDLRGKRIGIWRSSFGQLAQMVDRYNQLQIEWIPFVQSINLYISGAIDATMAMTYNEVFWIRSSGFEDKKIFSLAELGYDYPEEGLYIARSYYERYPKRALAFAEASRRGWEWARKHPEEALKIVLKVMEQEHETANLDHQRWMLKEVLNLQCPAGEQKPNFTLNPTHVENINTMLLGQHRIEKRISIEQIQGR